MTSKLKNPNPNRNPNRSDNPIDTVVLLINLGTPESLTWLSVYKFLRMFLWDRRVVDLPRVLWWLILHLFVLPLRISKLLKLYQNIWTKEGSPLQVWTQRLASGLERKLIEEGKLDCKVYYAMTYGTPDIASCLTLIEKNKISRLIIIPLFPQYSATTTAAIFDKIANHFKRSSYIPTLHFINEYATVERYQEAIEESIREHWQHEGKTEQLLFSFHGIPLRYAHAGDPYPEQCQNLAKALARRLNIQEDGWGFSFQSRFGFNRWLEPGTEDTITRLGKKGVKSLTLLSPSFSVDCLETLEEINIRYRKKFQALGGEKFNYISALNDSERHLDVLISLINPFFKKNY